MDYISAVAVDFGSTNSGCARVISFDEEGKLKYDTPHLVHNTGLYAKDNTWFYIEPSFLQRLIRDYDSVQDSDFRIESRILHNDNPNIVWSRASIKHCAERLSSENWIEFKNFKMLLRDGREDTMLAFPLVLIIKIFLRILKLECLAIEKDRMNRAVSTDEICWGITIPAIWNDENKRIMVECAHSVFSRNTRILSEPEGALVAHLLMAGASGKVEFKDGRNTMVIDLGGGTTDICLMKEVRQPDGSYKIEMVANTDGSAAGGNDIDRDFYLYMLRTISKGKLNDAGIAYDSMDDESLMREAFDGFRAEIVDFMEFEDNWLKLKSKRDLAKQATCDFTFTRQYRKWLEDNGHKQLASEVKEMLVDGCEFPSADFKANVLEPTFKKICDKVSEIISHNKDSVAFDSIVLAGGMSQNFALNEAVKNTIRSILGDAGIRAIKEAPGLFAGSSIMTGTCFLLLNRGFIERLARRSYYYDCIYEKAVAGLREAYSDIGFSIKSGELNSIFEEEQAKGYATRGRGGYVVLSPIVLKNMIVKPYKTTLSTYAGQTKVSVAFYSTDGQIVIFSDSDNPLLKKEGEINVDCSPSTSYELEVDFNEGQISNALHYIFKETETGKIMKDDYIRDVVK